MTNSLVSVTEPCGTLYMSATRPELRSDIMNVWVAEMIRTKQIDSVLLDPRQLAQNIYNYVDWWYRRWHWDTAASRYENIKHKTGVRGSYDYKRLQWQFPSNGVIWWTSTSEFAADAAAINQLDLYGLPKNIYLLFHKQNNLPLLELSVLLHQNFGIICHSTLETLKLCQY